MALYYSKNGVPIGEPPYTDEENWEFEQRLRRGGDITIIRQRQPVRPEPSQDDPDQLEQAAPASAHAQQSPRRATLNLVAQIKRVASTGLAARKG